MKKLLMLIVCAMLFVPSIIFADMGAPMIHEYEAMVTAKDGAKIYDDNFNGKLTGDSLSYGTVIKINFEENGFASVEGGYVKLTDLAPVEKDYKFDATIFSKKTSGVVLSKTEIKRGPAGTYETIEELNPGDTVTLYLDGGDYEASWAYVENKGYVDTLGSVIAYTPRTANLIAIYDISIGNEKLKSGEKFTAKIYDLDPWSHAYYVVYKGNKVIVSNGDISPEQGEAVVTAESDCNIYESMLTFNQEEKDFKKIGTFKKGETFKTNYYDIENYHSAFYYENGSTKGWVYWTDDTKDCKIDYDYTDENPNLTTPEVKEEKIDTQDIPTEEIAPITTPDIQSNESTTTTGPSTVEKNVPENMYLYIAVGICIGLSAAVAILLIDRKKNNNKEK